MRRAALGKAEIGINIAGRNINNLSYVNDIVFLVESEEDLNDSLLKVKERRAKTDLPLILNKLTKIYQLLVPINVNK